MNMNKKISAVIACYNDVQAIPIMHERLVKVFQKIGCPYEIIFVNDGSPDNSTEVIRGIVQRDSSVIGIVHSRNFSVENAFMSGLASVSGDAAVLLDGDLQDPPELIEEFVKKWQDGYDVVYGIRKKREAFLLMQFAYKFFYRLFRKMSYIHIPVDAGNFSLLDRRVVEVLKQFTERDIFIRGLRAWAGFKQTGIEYVRPERMFGVSHGSLLKNIRWARKGIFSFSYEPLEFIFYLASLTFFIAIIAIIIYLASYFIKHNTPQGFTTITILILFFSSIQLLSLAIIGEYLGRIFEEVKQRPKYIVKEIIKNNKEN